MNAIGTKVDVPYGKLWTRILEASFPSISEDRAVLLGFLS